MKQLRDNWAILCGLVIVAVMAGRTLQRVDRIEQDVSAIRTRLGLADSRYPDPLSIINPSPEGFDSCPAQLITDPLMASNFGQKPLELASLGDPLIDFKPWPNSEESAYPH